MAEQGLKTTATTTTTTTTKKKKKKKKKTDLAMKECCYILLQYVRIYVEQEMYTFSNLTF